ncbi:emp24/gp25L/p24 family protein [Pontiella sulfatireligans]|uniref:Uncharacterized protein n=1 Tax=Pontiella sulfatireligans TaxID=2750658 RepID=A0A6C2UPL4_9BACT|nr:emp24/gp25L/p24 family protein [Pontiella sulfatireligans]VGO21254.1 hypothetical protein SCARR_03326 [Pontiella sulfatireligans]
MSDTDIYKQREPAQLTGNDPKLRKSHRKRRSASRKSFDESGRKRRQKNSGLRRILHLSRKAENEKFFWWSVLWSIVVILGVIGVWQYWYLEHVAREQSEENDTRVPVYNFQPSNLPVEESP